MVEFFWPQTYPSLSCLQTPTHALPPSAGVTRKFSLPTASPGSSACNGIRIHPLLSPQSHLWSQPCSSLTWSPHSAFVPVESTLHRAAQGPLKARTTWRLCPAVRPAYDRIHHELTKAYQTLWDPASASLRCLTSPPETLPWLTTATPPNRSCPGGPGLLGVSSSERPPANWSQTEPHPYPFLPLSGHPQSQINFLHSTFSSRKLSY